MRGTHHQEDEQSAKEAFNRDVFASLSGGTFLRQIVVSLLIHIDSLSLTQLQAEVAGRQHLERRRVGFQLRFTVIVITTRTMHMLLKLPRLLQQKATLLRLHYLCMT